MKKKLTMVAIVVGFMFVPTEVLAGPNEDLHMACKTAIKTNLQGRAILRRIDYNPSNAIAKYRVRGSTGAQYVTCIKDKQSGRITLIDRETESSIEMIAGL